MLDISRIPQSFIAILLLSLVLLTVAGGIRRATWRR
jgi:hypothetical protein